MSVFFYREGNHSQVSFLGPKFLEASHFVRNLKKGLRSKHELPNIDIVHSSVDRCEQSKCLTTVFFRLVHNCKYAGLQEIFIHFRIGANTCSSGLFLSALAC